jgi:hypothetical protein
MLPDRPHAARPGIFFEIGHAAFNFADANETAAEIRGYNIVVRIEDNGFLNRGDGGWYVAPIEQNRTQDMPGARAVRIKLDAAPGESQRGIQGFRIVADFAEAESPFLVLNAGQI